MVEKEEWTPFSWHCPNCGAIVTGYKNKKGSVKVECKRCRATMVRTPKDKKHDCIDIFAPKGQVRRG